MECAQLQITGGGSTSPATVSFPGAYSGKYCIYLPFLCIPANTIPVFQVPTPGLRSTSTRPSHRTLFPDLPYSPAPETLILHHPLQHPWFLVLVLPQCLVVRPQRRLPLRVLPVLVRHRSMLNAEVR